MAKFWLFLIFIILVNPLAVASPISREDRGRFKARIQLIASDYWQITDEQLDLLAEIQSGIEVNSDLIAFLSGYKGGMQNLISHLKQLVDWRRDVQRGRDRNVIEQWLKLPGMTGVDRIYRSLLSDGWSIELTAGGLTAKGKPVAGVLKPQEKSVRASVGLSDESPVLVFAEEILHAADWRIYESNKETIEKWIRLVIAENNTPGIDRLNQSERYSWQFQAALEQAAKNLVSGTDVYPVLEFLLEQSAYFQKASIYKALVTANGSYRQGMWDTIVESADPRETINIILSSLRFEHLRAGLTSRIGTVALEQIVSRSGKAAGDSVMVGLNLPSLSKAEIPWSHFDYFLAVVPVKLRHSDLSMVNAFNASEMRSHVKNTSKADIEAYGQYIVNSHLSALPYRAGDAVRQRFAREAGPAYRPATEVYKHFEYICALMVQYDLANGTHYTEEYGFKMLSQLHRDNRMRDYDSLIGLIAGRLKAPDATPQMAAAFIEALIQSRAAGGFINEVNGLDNLRNTLRKAVGVIPARTLDAIVLVRYNFFVSSAQTNREGSSFMDLMTAQAAAKMGLEIMQLTGDELLVREYETRTREIDELVASARNKSNEDYRMRDKTPKDYDKTKMPMAAAALIIAANQAQKTLEKADPKTFDSIIKAAWLNISRSCRELLSSSIKPKK